MDIIEHTLKNRYYQPNETCWSDLALRVANHIGKTKEESEEFFKAINEKKFIPNSPTLMNAGTKINQYSACFVLTVPDDMEGIGETLKNSMLIAKSGGGVGFSFEKIRPKDSPVASTNGVASGVVSFMSLFNAATETVKQAGKRRGANMGVLPIWHPDIEDFIDCKTKDGDLANFNISVALTDEFLKCVKENKDWNLTFNGKTYKTVKSRDLFSKITNNMWNNGEPGVIFIDTINKDDLFDEPVLATNPCVTGDTLILTRHGEYPIASLIYEEIDIWNGFEWSTVMPYYTGNYKTYSVEFDNKTTVTTNANHEWCVCGNLNIRYTTEELYNAFNNNTLLDGYPLETYKFGGHNDPFESKYHEGHKITFICKTTKVEPTYCLTEPKLHTFIANGILTGNCGELPLITNGACNLGSIDVSKYYKNNKFNYSEFDKTIKLGVYFLNNIIDLNGFPLKQISETVQKYRQIGLGLMGFADLLIMMEIKYGSEESYKIAEEIASFLKEKTDLYSIQYANENNTIPNTTKVCMAPTGTISLFAECSSGIEPNYAYKYNRKTWTDGTETSFEQYHKLFEPYSDNPPDYFVTALDIDPKDHIKMQATFQKYCDNGISKTINIPNNATKENVGDLIYQAWNSGCKGFTMYRDGSRSSQVLSTKEIEETRLRRPEKLSGTTYKELTGCGKPYITINEYNNKPYEVIVESRGAGGCAALLEGLGRSISIGLRNGVDPSNYIKQLGRVECPSCKGKKLIGKSCADIIGKCLEDYIKSKHISTEPKEEKQNDLKCPECGETLIRSEGCFSCLSCGYTKCK